MTRSTRLSNDLFAIGSRGGWGGPQRGNIGRHLANGFSLGLRKEAWLVLDKAVILFLKLLLCCQFLFPGTFQRPSHKPMLRFDCM